MTRISKSLILILSFLIVSTLFVTIPEAAVSIDNPSVTAPADPDEPVILVAEEPTADPEESRENDSWTWSAVGLGSAIILVLIFALRPRDGSSGPT